jgi:uncharacterized protein
MAEIGRRNSLHVLHNAPQGLYLDGGDLGQILLPNRYAPDVLPPGQPVDVFVYRDSEDRLVATTETPLIQVGEFACLRVIATHEKAGAFLDWGLQKDLLLPFREQTGPVRDGQWIVVRAEIDERSGRIVASARLDRFLDQAPPRYRIGQEVSLLVSGRTPLGYSVVIENAHRGLLFQNNVAQPLRLGERLTGYVREVRDDGKIDLSLDAIGYHRIASATDKILEALARNDGRLEFDDDSSPQSIRASFEMSKKAFKQALGGLFKQGQIVFREGGIDRVTTPVEAPKRPVPARRPLPERPAAPTARPPAPAPRRTGPGPRRDRG